MPQDGTGAFAKILVDHEQGIQGAWLEALRAGSVLLSGRLKEAELKNQVRSIMGLLKAFVTARESAEKINAEQDLHAALGDISRARATQGFSPSDTAQFIFSLKQPVFKAMSNVLKDDPTMLVHGILSATELLDNLALHTMETFQTSREDVILRQSREIGELSSPVVRLWEGILALPLIGTLDSSRTQTVMENLLQSIVDEEASIAIIDITGVPTVDTLVAQHLLKTVAAARLMGADCLISGIRPQIAQTMVHLGVELNVVSKATLADAFALALKRTGRAVVSRPASGAPLREGA